MIHAAATPTHCELCGRELELTRHHLIPRTRHHNRRIKRQYQREEMRGRLLWVCRPCHNQIHTVFSEKQLADHYNTRHALLENAQIARFVEWIRNKPSAFQPQSRQRRR